MSIDITALSKPCLFTYLSTRWLCSRLQGRPNVPAQTQYEPLEVIENYQICAMSVSWKAYWSLDRICAQVLCFYWTSLLLMIEKRNLILHVCYNLLYIVDTL